MENFEDNIHDYLKKQFTLSLGEVKILRVTTSIRVTETLIRGPSLR